MKCFNCDKELTLVNKRGVMDYKDIKNLEFIYETQECLHCHEAFNTPEHQKNKLVAIADAFRAKKKLFASKEIRAFRTNLSMSQDKFAEYLGVGVASIRRWEGSGIQDLSQNEIIRLKCDEHSEVEQFVNRWQNEPATEFTGYRKFNIAAIAAIFSHFNSYAKSPLYFFKALFYVDVYHFLKEKVGVTGVNYACLQYGPIPRHYEIVLDYLTRHYGKKINDHDIHIDNIFDETMFSDSENQAIAYVESVLKAKGKEYIFKHVHDHPAFKNTEYKASISYEAIRSINI